MAEQPKEHALPSLVADDLVDLVRGSLAPGNPFGAVPLTVDYTTDDQRTTAWPIHRTDGRPVALEYAIVELLVEIRDRLGDDSVARLAHVHFDQATEPESRRATVFDAADLEIVEDRLDVALRPAMLGGRQTAVIEIARRVFEAWLREKGLLR